MSSFNATDAIFFGFRVVKRDPTLLLVLAVLLAATGLVGVQLAWRELVEFVVALEGLSGASAQADPEAGLSAMVDAYGNFLGSPKVQGLLLIQVLVTLVAQGAVLRSLVRDRREGWVLGLQLGGDELRIFVVGLAVALLVLLFGVVACIAVIIVAGLLSALHPVLGGVAGLLAFLAGALALLLVSVRLGAAAPASVGERKFIVLGSWRLTRGRMWGLLGAYVVLLFLWLVGALAVFVLSSFLAPHAAALMQGMTPLTAVEDPAAAFRSPGYILVTVLNALLSVVFMAAWSGVGAYAYRMLGGGAGYPNAHPPEDGATAAA